MTMDRRTRARIAAFELHAQGKTNTANARAAFRRKFEQKVDPTFALPTEERVAGLCLASTCSINASTCAARILVGSSGM